MSAVLGTLPILLTIFCGYLVARGSAVPRERWEGINALSFQLLIPAMILRAVAGSDLSSSVSGRWIGAIFLTLGVLALLVLGIRRLADQGRLPDPAFTSLFQTTTRWNAFIALAAAEQLAGPNGLALLAVAMAFLVPIINVMNIVVLAVYGSARVSAGQIVLSILRNPLVQACAVGLVISLSGIALPGPVMGALDLIGRAALGIGLLAVGAGISLKRLLGASGRIWLGVALRPGVSTALFLAVARALGLNPDEMLPGAMVFAVPAAANGYIVARQMGGDAALYAEVLTWQTLVSMLVLPALVPLVAALG